MNQSAIAQQVRKVTERAIVAFSGGIDSVATLALCSRFFELKAFFMFMVPGLEFQEVYLRYIEQRFQIEIIHLPHFGLGRMFRYASLRPHTKKAMACPILNITDIERKVREQTGFEWIASGHKIVDSIERNGMLKANKGIDEKTKRFYPIAHWSEYHVLSYLKLNNIHLPKDYKLFKHSFGRLWVKELSEIKTHYPEDYQRILEYFPYAEAQLKRYEFGQQVPEI